MLNGMPVQWEHPSLLSPPNILEGKSMCYLSLTKDHKNYADIQGGGLHVAILLSTSGSFQKSGEDATVHLAVYLSVHCLPLPLRERRYNVRVLVLHLERGDPSSNPSITKHFPWEFVPLTTFPWYLEHLGNIEERVHLHRKVSSVCPASRISHYSRDKMKGGNEMEPGLHKFWPMCYYTIDRYRGTHIHNPFEV